MKSLLVVLLLFMLVGCSEEQPVSYSKKEEVKAGDLLVDVDLTSLSNTMLYAKIYDIMDSPKDYLGKTIKIVGMFAKGEDEDGNNHYAIAASDLAGCCVSALEVIWVGDHVYPDDYPELNQVIKIQGEFKTFEYKGNTMYYIETHDIMIFK